jgi:hypothetical protein
MQTLTYNIYTLDELDDKAKEKAREWYRDGNNFPFLEEAMIERAHELLKEAKIKADNVKVFYSLSYCQVDGAMIEMTGTWGKYHFTVKQSGRYYHYNSKNIELWNESGEVSLDADEKVYCEFNDLYVDICHKLEKYGYACIDAENEDSIVDETILANAYTFLVDGTRHD